jgi:hypothetical protein
VRKERDNKKIKDKKRYPPFSFARGSISYFILAFIILVILLFGIFDPRKPKSDEKVLGSYGDYLIVATKQGKNVYEVVLQHKNVKENPEPIPIDNIKNVLWIMAQTFEIQSFHPIEERGEVYGLIITVQEK